MNLLIDKLLNSDFINRNIIVTFLILILIGLNMLGIDIEYITDSKYLLVILVIVNLFVTIILYPLSNLKIKSLDTYLGVVEEVSELIGDTKEDYELFKVKLNTFEKNFSSLYTLIHDLHEEVKGIPNIKLIRLVLELRTRGLWNDFFRECLKYTLTATKENAEIVLSTCKNNVEEYIVNYVNFIALNIRNYDVDETLSKEIKNKINANKENIYQELIKSKKTEEKLYIVSLLLKSMQDDINKLILEYLRSIQANIV